MNAASSLAQRARPGMLPKLAARGIVFLYIGIVVALPIALVFRRGLADGPAALLAALADDEAVAAFALSFQSALSVSIASVLFGTAVAFVLVRLRFSGRRLLNALVDLPLALPTSVTGLTLAAILGPNSSVGAWLAARGAPVLYEPAAVFLACLVVTLPFGIRSVQPLLESVDRSEEEAAATMGAGPFRIFASIILPVIRPGIVSGAALTFARALGEFGAIVFVAGAEPFRTQVAATLVYARIESFDFRGAAAASTVVLGASFLLLASARKLEESASGRSRP